MIASRIDFKSPRQKEWGIIREGTLTSRPYGHETDESGNELTYYSSNCYEDVLKEVHTLLASGTGSMNIQMVEFVPYDYIMQPNV